MPACEVAPARDGTLVRDMHNKRSDSSFRPLESRRFSLDEKKDILKQIVGFLIVAENSSAHAPDQPGVAAEQQAERLIIICANPRDECFVRRLSGRLRNLVLI